MLYKIEVNINNINCSQSKIINMIDDNSTVLDLGCACGDIGDYLHQHKNCILTGLEYDIERIKFAKQRNVYKELFQLDLNDINKTNETLSNLKNKFDYIICGDILEHLYNPQDVIKNLKSFLKANGYFVISLPNIAHGSIKLNLLKDNFSYTKLGLLDETHIRFFTHKSISSFLLQTRLELIEFNHVFRPFDSPSENVKMLDYPIEIIKYIAEDEKAFIYQYVFKAKKALYDEETSLDYLKSINQAQMIMSENEKKGLEKCIQRTFEQISAS